MYYSLSDFSDRLRIACTAENAQFFIVYHINPDGDCIGSAYALALILRELGAKVCVCGRDSVPEQFRSMTAAVSMDSLDESAQYIAVDCSDRSRTGQVLGTKQYAFWIDHHGAENEQAAIEYVHPERSACSELVLDLAEMLGVPITKQLADLLYTALVTDTSCFRTSSTNEASFLSAARLIQAGANPYEIGRKQTMIKSKERIALESRIFSGLHELCGGRLITGMITQKDLAEIGIADQNAPAMQNINNLLEIIDSAELTVMVREYPPENPEGHSRFAVKAISPLYSAKAIAKHFGGGGHIPAAGGFLKKSPEETRALLEDYCCKLLG